MRPKSLGVRRMGSLWRAQYGVSGAYWGVPFLS
jgi:hypothetical protein